MPAALPYIEERFVAQCSPVVNTNYKTAGTQTRAHIDHLALTDVEALFATAGVWHDMNAWLMHSIEMNACGTPRYSFYDWIMGNADRTSFKAARSFQKTAKGPQEMYPFIFGLQETVINRDYFTVESLRLGKATAGTEEMLIAATAYDGGTGTTVKTALITTDITGSIVKTAAGSWAGASSNLGVVGVYVARLKPTTKNNAGATADFFRPSDTLHIFSKADDGTALHGQYRIVAAKESLVTAVTYVDVAVVPINVAGYQKAPTLPSTTAYFSGGIVIMGINNVTDYESWCSNLPNVDGKKRVPFWVQTWRTARRVDDLYKEWFAKLLQVNPAFKEFGDLPLAQRNAQDELEEKKRFCTAFLFNKPISTNQTTTLWESLEGVFTPSGTLYSTTNEASLAGKIMTKRANFIGVKEQLNLCERAFDLLGGSIDFYGFLDLNYRIKRARPAGTKDIDWMTNSQFAEAFKTSYIKYVVQQYGGNPNMATPDWGPVRINADFGKVTSMGDLYDSYRVGRPGGVNINIITNEFFDDWYDEFYTLSTSDPTRGNLLVCLDIGRSIYWAQTDTNRKTHRSAELDQLAKFDSTYRCVMEMITEEVTMYSQQGTAVVECPLWNAWIENFNNVITVDKQAQNLTQFADTDAGAGMVAES